MRLHSVRKSRPRGPRQEIARTKEAIYVPYQQGAGRRDHDRSDGRRRAAHRRGRCRPGLRVSPGDHSAPAWEPHSYHYRPGRGPGHRETGLRGTAVRNSTGSELPSAAHHLLDYRPPAGRPKSDHRGGRLGALRPPSGRYQA